MSVSCECSATLSVFRLKSKERKMESKECARAKVAKIAKGSRELRGWGEMQVRAKEKSKVG